MEQLHGRALIESRYGKVGSGVQIMEIAGSVTEAVLCCILLRHQRHVMALEAKLVHRNAELVLEVGGVLGVAAEAIVFLDRAMDTLLAGLVVVTLVTDLGTLVLNPVQTVITLMVAGGSAVAGGTLSISQSAMDERSGHLAAVTLVAGLTANCINSALGFSG